METKSYFLILTRRCNLNCAYCYQLDKPQASMSAEKVEEVIRFLLSDDPGKKKSIVFFGGEPTLEWDAVVRFTERFKRLRDVIKFSITTNGLLLTEKRLAFLRSRKVGLALSLDGPPGVTRKTRPGSEKVNVDLVAKYFPKAQIIMTLCPENIEDAYDSTLWFVEKGFTRIAHNLMTEKPWPKEAVENHHEFFHKISDWQIAVGRKKGVGFMFVGYAQKVINNSVRSGQQHICGASANQIAIDMNGDIYPCQDMVTCDKRKRYMLGNIKSGYKPAQPISIERMKFPKDRAECPSCWFYHQCVGGCGPKNIVAGGDRFTVCANGCELYSRQTQEGLRVLLNTGQIQMRNDKVKK